MRHSSLQVAASFALNQIRKIMGLALSVLQGAVPEEVVDVALSGPFQVSSSTDLAIPHIYCLLELLSPGD